MISHLLLPRSAASRSRSRLVRAWTIAGIALVTAALTDGGTEYAENLGWLGGVARDHAQQAVLPALFFGIAVIVTLALYVAARRTVGGSPARFETPALAQRSMDLAWAFAGSALLVTAMEGYETTFGAPSPFSSNTILIAHAPVLLLAFAITASAVRMLIGALMRIAARAGDAAAHVIATYLRATARSSAPAARISSFLPCPLALQPAIAADACGLRAPPL